MSLDLALAVPGLQPPVYAAVECELDGTEYILTALKSGRVHVYAKKDAFLVRTFSGPKSPVSITTVTGTPLVAVIGQGTCQIHNLSTRELVFQVSTSSAQFAASGPLVLAVGSNYKVRLFQFNSNGELLNSGVAEMGGKGGKLKVLQLAYSNSGFLVVLNGKARQLWLINAESTNIENPSPRPVLVLPKTVQTGSHVYVSAIGDSLFVGTSSGHTVLQRSNTGAQVVSESSEAEFGGCLGCSTVITDPTKIPLYIVSFTNKKLAVINPVTGTVLISTPNMLNAALSAPKLAIAVEGVYECKVDMPTEFVKQSSEAGSLAFGMTGSKDKDLIAIEIEFAGQLLDTNIYEAMKLFTTIEEQDTTQTVHLDILAHLEPFIQRLPENNGGTSIRSVANSTFTARSIHKNHVLDPVAAFLMYTRRKLRLEQSRRADSLDNNDNEEDKHEIEPEAVNPEPLNFKRIDTALFLCYLQMKSPLIGPFLRTHNECDLETVKSALLTRGKWKELVWFLRQRKTTECQRLALDLLVEHKQPPEQIVQFIEQSNPIDLDLVLEYTRPFLKSNKEYVYRLFFEQRWDVVKVFNILKEIQTSSTSTAPSSPENASEGTPAPSDSFPQEDLAGEFALHCCEKWDTTIDLLNEEAVRYAAKTNPGRCLNLVCRGYCRPEKLMHDVNIPEPARAQLYLMANDPSGAIELYLDIGDIEEALKQAVANELVSFFIDKIVISPDLLKTFLSHKSSWLGSSLATELLEKLPNSMAYSEVSDFVVYSITAELQRAELTESKSVASVVALSELSIKLSQLKRRRFEIDVQDTCYICHKRLGKAVVGADGDQIAHYACMH